MKIMQLEYVEQLTTGGDEVTVGKKWYFSTLVTTSTLHDVHTWVYVQWMIATTLKN